MPSCRRQIKQVHLQGVEGLHLHNEHNRAGPRLDMFRGDKGVVGAPLVARQRKLLAIEDEVEGRVEGIGELRIPVEYC